ATELAAQRSDLDDDRMASFRERMFGSEFVFNVSRDFVGGCDTPLLVLAGNDNFHPMAIAEEITELAPKAELVREWRDPAVVARTVERVRAFLRSHTPAEARTASAQ